jgi:hypothetical protein
MGSIAAAFLVFASGVTLTERVTYASMFGVISLVEARLVFGGLWIRAWGILVRNPLRTYRIDWAEFDSFDMRRWLIYPDVGHVVKRNGRAVAVASLSVVGVDSLFGDEEAVPEAIDYLEKLVSGVRKN